MIRQYCIPLTSREDWTGALSGIRHAFAHTWESSYAMHLTSGMETFLYCLESEEVRIVCPIAERAFGGHTDILTPFGFGGFVGKGEFPEFPMHWRRFVADKGYVCGYIVLNPVLEDVRYYEREDAYQYNTVHILDLGLSYDQLYRNLSTNRRRQLRNWDSICANIVLNDPGVNDFFLRKYLEFVQSKSAPLSYRFSEDTLSYLCSLDNVFLVGYVDSGKIVAASVFAFTDDVGEYLFNVSVSEGQRHSVSLIWYGANYLKALGIPVLNLGGGYSRSAEQGDSLAEFKMRFGGQRLPLRCLKQIYVDEVYVDLCRKARVDPGDSVGYFPPYARMKR